MLKEPNFQIFQNIPFSYWFWVYWVILDSQKFQSPPPLPQPLSEQVGSYNDTNFLKLDITYDTDYQAKCSPDGIQHHLPECTCPFKPFQPSRFMKKDNQGRGMTLAYVGDIHKPHPTDKFSCGPINTGKWACFVLLV